MANFLDFQGLQQLVGVIKDKFVQKESGKSLSTNDYTDEEKQKLSTLKTYNVATSEEAGLLSSANLNKINSIDEGAEKNVITKIKRNGTLVNISNKEVDITVPTKYSELVNDKDLVSSSQVKTLISEARHMKKEIVSTKPSTGEENVIYLVGPKGSGNNIYEEWLYINGQWEKIGDTDTKVDLSGYLKTNDIKAITTEEINQVMGD
ncbi:hypothetical protein QP531_06380 [Peptoniphilus harei]|uniref:hypothetical protein n=1 Tax=Peptoniphilus harei TaxID=54005 RepID=UPI00254E65E4|nr:hypothetical protein [Peptoniphilus harei]MDK7377442.1 hypothetical protein [Peptoniphilus harei]MDK7679755.1 hypothetical protein [Peptoniphilus harei]